ncbi:MAG: 23S rRNA (adenine(1618)-N(6))-methyltransferase RlmF [Rikenellaceae bacterium]
MPQVKIVKGELHPRNPHRDGYDFEALVKAHAPLERFVALNKYGTLSINFFDPQAVRALNAALLALHYNIGWWEIPSSALTPPIPGRADYIHYVADLAPASTRCLDVGVGANCIYPIIGSAAYGWEFVGSDISKSSIESARQIVERNSVLSGRVELRHQADPTKIFDGVINNCEHFDITLCNPPFHASAEAAAKGTQRKLRGLKATSKGNKAVLNFGGESNELWCEGGERKFVERMISESRQFATQCGWFTSLISNEDNLAPLRRALNSVGVREQRTIEMYQGNKRSRILAWRF